LNRQIFLIAGMHRSGTSYLAKSLNLLGLQLPKSIRPGGSDNPKGHFESFRVAQYHDALLNDMGLSWDTFISPMDDWFFTEDATQAVVGLCDVLERDYPRESHIVLKDPRISLFIPLWKNVADRLGMQDYYLIPFRHPFDIATSLHNRNNISRTRALLIWLAYLFAEEKFSRGLHRSFLCFPDWVEDIEHTIDKVEQDLGVLFPAKSQKNLIRVKSEFEQSLVHCGEDLTSATNQIERLAFDVFEKFKGLVESPNDSEVIADLDNLYVEFKYISMLSASPHMDMEQIDTLRFSSTNTIDKGLLRESERQNTKLKVGLHSAHIEKDDLHAQIKTLREIIEGNEDRYADLLLQLKDVTDKKDKLGIENSALKMRNNMLAKEFEQLIIETNKQKFSIMRPLYRNLYRLTGFALRMLFSATFVESLKKVVPDPNGVPKHLTYRHVKNKELQTPLEVFAPANTTAAPDVIVLSIINWNFRVQRPQHIARNLAVYDGRVFYLEMELEGRGLSINTIAEKLYRVRLSGKGVGHIQPYTGQPSVEQTEQWLDVFYQFCDSVCCTAFKQVVIQHPFWWNLARHLPPEFQIIFDCMDDISGFSNTDQRLLDLEHDLLSKCDELVVSSQHLFNKYKHYRKPVLIRNAADTEHFAGSSSDLVCPGFLMETLSKVGSGAIKVGYVGAIAEWFDTDLLKEVVESDSSLEFHLCGSVTAAGPEQLEVFDNVHMHGEISYKDVPGFINKMDVMIIPFKIIPIIEACDPVKFYEYSAMKKPTVTTPLPELSRAKDLIFEASTATEFREQIYNAYEQNKSATFQEQLRKYARDNTWESRGIDFKKMLAETPRVSIIILGYGDHEITKAAVSSLYNKGSCYPNMEVVIVDNGSATELLNDLNDFIGEYPDVRMIENRENLGFAKGNNIGIEAATGEYVLLLNNDAYVAPGAVYSMVSHLVNNPEIGVVGPLTNSIGNEAKLFVEYEDMDQMRSVARRATTGYRGMFTPIPVVAYFAAMIRQKDLKEFGLLSEDYGVGMFEDDDHCAMIKSKGYLCALAEDAFVHHEHSASFSRIDGGKKEALFERNMKIFENKWGVWKMHKYRQERPAPTHRE